MRHLNDRRTVVLDSHPLWLEAIERVLERIGISVVLATTVADDATEAITRERPDLLVVGVDDDGAFDGIDVARAVRNRFPEMCIIALGDDRTADAVAAAIDAGVSAYVLKSVHPDDLAAAVRQSFGPSIYFADTVLPRPPASAARRASATDDVGLTRREVEILRLVAEGHSNGALARMLWVTEQTVKFHLSNIYRKLDVANRTEASRWAQLHGFLEAEHGEQTAALAGARS